MARHIGPVCKLCRREGRKLFLKGVRCTTKCALDRRGDNPPGFHSARRRKPTEYSIQLREKQKARRIYGVLERQFRKHYHEAARKAGATGETLVRILEMRLDNVVFRLGLAESRSQARQLVTHGHIVVNTKKTDIPSYIVKVGDVVSVRAVNDSSVNDPYSRLLKAVRCEFYDPLTSNWSSVGCKTIGFAANFTGVTCACTHLTEFAIWFDTH